MTTTIGRKLVRNTRGAGIIEYGLLVGLIAITAIGTLTPMGSYIVSQAQRTTAGLDSVAPATSGDDCVHGTDAPDAMMPSLNHTCYVLGKGPDYFFGAAATANLTLFAGTGSGADIATGSGDDTLILAQSGKISSGAGNDTLAITLGEQSPGRSDIDLGPGTDGLSLSTILLPDRLSRHRIHAGPGEKTIQADCQGDTIELILDAGSSSSLSGSCAFDVSQTAGRTIAMTRIAARGIAGLSGTLHGNIAFTATVDAGPANQTLTLRDASLLEIDYAATLSGQASFKIIAGENGVHPSSTVDVSIAAASGTLMLEGAGAEDWNIDLAFASGGAANLVFPDGADFSAMALPRITGHLATLHLGGCFEAIDLIGTGGSVRMSGADACPSATDRTLTLQVPEDATRIVLTRSGISTSLDLGPEALSVASLRLSR